MTEAELSEAAADYIEGRGLNVETAARFGLFTETGSRIGKSDWSEAIAFPNRRNGDVLGIKYKRFPDKAHSQAPGSKNRIYNGDVLEEIAESGEALIVVEGEWDLFAMIDSGYWNTISVPSATVTQGGDMPEWLEVEYDALAGIKRIILAVDNDAKGRSLREALIDYLDLSRCMVVDWPRGCKDANNVLQAHGTEGVAALVRSATFVEHAGKYRFVDVWNEPDPVYHPAGWPTLDDVLRIATGRLMIVTGTPGAGKSTFARQLVSRLVMQHGWAATIASFEEERKVLGRALCQHYLGKPQWHWTEADERRALDWLDSHFEGASQSLETNRSYDIDWLLDVAETDALRRRIRILLVDPWSHLDTNRPPYQSEHEWIGQSLKRLSRFSRAYDVLTIIVAHPKKLTKDGDGKYEPPTPYDISGSAHWFNAADYILCVHAEDKKARLAQVRVDKVRMLEMGSDKAVLQFAFEPATLSFEGGLVLEPGVNPLNRPEAA